MRRLPATLTIAALALMIAIPTATASTTTHEEAPEGDSSQFAGYSGIGVGADGLPLAFHLTGGEAGDSPEFETLLDLGPDITPRAGVGDKGKYVGCATHTRTPNPMNR